MRMLSNPLLLSSNKRPMMNVEVRECSKCSHPFSVQEDSTHRNCTACRRSHKWDSDNMQDRIKQPKDKTVYRPRFDGLKGIAKEDE